MTRNTRSNPLSNPDEQDPSLCAHLEPGAYPLHVVAVLDASMGITDALVRCERCGQLYFIEMLDQQAALRLFRLRVVSEDAGRALLRDLDRGSCDLSRAAEETRHVRLSSPLSNRLLLVDTAAPVISALAPAGRRIDTSSWRELPCDGSWIDAVLAQARA